MKLSSRAQYGLLAVMDLALFSAGHPVQANQIAERQGIPKMYLDQLMMDLKRAGLVVSSRGRQGGYQLARLPNAITLWDVVVTFEGLLCEPPRHTKGCGAVTCEVLKHFMDEACSSFAAVLKEHTIQDVCQVYRKSIRKPAYQI